MHYYQPDAIACIRLNDGVKYNYTYFQAVLEIIK